MFCNTTAPCSIRNEDINCGDNCPDELYLQAICLYDAKSYASAFKSLSAILEKWPTFSPAQYFIATMYHSGTGVAKDYAKAVYFYQKAADADNRNAQFGLAIMYDDGYGVEKDTKQATYWCTRAAMAGHRNAQFFVEVRHFIARDRELYLERLVLGRMLYDTQVLNHNDNLRKKIIGTNAEYEHGGILPFGKMSLETFDTLSENGFVNLDGTSYGSPTPEDFRNLLKTHNEENAYLHGYLVSPARKDYGVVIRGISGCSHNRSFIFDFWDLCFDADRFRCRPGYQYSWYD